ncbi:heat shock 70 kDa protein 12B-like isoform X5 [Ostrea edulis]|uniref:heat shock 70 kDa protein 12B-like isoform X5 n=1 Tax=Ostrea edulis TaxID=37623 RepID=UPI0024AE9D95|nr:heat shock 70 kDa protein 12B-like isoform X5 [Ostrea edulis]
MVAVNVTQFLPMIVHIVQSCPRTAVAWRDSSDRLGCKFDSKDAKNRYHCVPDQQRSFLLEFCYDRTRTLVSIGKCLELANSGSLNFEDCDKSFSYGCPTNHYYSDEMYQHPACLEINTEQQCFVAANGCEKPNVPNNILDPADTGDSMTAYIGYILFGVLFVLVMAFLIKKRRAAIYSFLMSLSCVSRLWGGSATAREDEKQDPSHQAESENSEAEEITLLDATNTNDPSHQAESPTSEAEDTALLDVTNTNDPSYQAESPNSEADDTALLDVTNTNERNESGVGAKIDSSLDYETVKKKDAEINMTEGQAPRRQVRKLEFEDPKRTIEACEKIVAAVDFGTTYSGYCFSTHEDYYKNPLKITSGNWEFSSWQKAFSMKIPTTILLDKDKNVKSFGFEAETEYADMDEADHKDYYYFQRFKMEISRQQVNKGEDVNIKDVLGKQISASFVIGQGIRYLKEELLRQIERTSLENIHWVFTYPGLWNFYKQGVLANAVIEAGIPKEKFVLTEEAQAVSYYLHHLPYYRQDGTSNMTVFVEGRKYLLLDAGGGTIDITVNQMQRDGTSKTLTKCSGPFGGTTVDNAFESIICDIVGQELMDDFIKTHPADYIEMMRNFEALKRKVLSINAEKVLLRLPMNLKDMYEAKHKPDISEKIQRAGYDGKLTWEDEKFRMTKNLFISLFDDAFKGIKQSIRESLDKEEAEGTKIILMVGGFSDSSQIQQMIVDEFMHLDVIVLPEPGLAVLRGAVLYGHQPVVFHSCKRTPCK